MTDPRIHLAIDNCFASKRWTEPEEWMNVIRDLGISHIEASADNECDPLYMGREYLVGWIKKIKCASLRTGVKVVNLYSGHGTYATLGLAHTNRKIRDRFLNEWLKPMAETAGTLDAGLGFFCHAFADPVLQDPKRYASAEHDLCARLVELAEYAGEYGCQKVGVEQMYTPHQIPWTVKGAHRLLREVNRKSAKPFYITIDVGHQCGQRKFMRPGYGKLKEAFRNGGNHADGLWLGPQSAYAQFFASVDRSTAVQNAAIARIEREMDKYPHLFAEYEDGDPYFWLETLGAYSPIIHLQQTTGKTSAHLPFTGEHNANGIIDGAGVLQALAAACQATPLGPMPKKCNDIYLTLEIFSGTVDMNHDILKRLRETVSYWRTYIPEDGIQLDQLLKAGVK